MHSTASFKYLSLAQKLRRQIAVGGLQPGDRLPTEDELVQEHGLSRITIRRALALLEKDGLVSRKRKLGTFVSRALEEPADLHLVRGSVIVLLGTGTEPADDGSVREPQGEEDHALSVVLRGMERTLSDRGFTVQIMSVGRDEAQDRARLARLASRQDVEGICTIGLSADRYRDLLGKLPLVHSCTFLPESLPWVGMSSEEATDLLVGHLLDQGHRRVAMICGPWVDSRAMARFAAGYQRAHQQRGLVAQRALIYQAYEGESLTDLALEALRPARGDRPTAIFGEDWRVCRGVLAAAREMGLTIPDDLSLVGVGQNIQYLDSPVGITAYVPANERIGMEAGRVLCDLIDRQELPSEPMFVPGQFIERQSVTAPPRNDPPNGQNRDE